MTLRLVLADDHALVRAGVRALLEQEPDFEVVAEAADGAMALDQVHQTQPDVVIMDLSMPRLNGIEATRQLRVDAPQVKVVALSQHADRCFVERAFQAGASGYVVKEEVHGELVRAIHTVVAGRVYLSPVLADRVGGADLPPPAPPTRGVPFVLEAPEAHAVFVAGSFNQWHPHRHPMAADDKGRWSLVLDLAPGTYEYRFVVDGQWQLDPVNPRCRPNPWGSANSVLALAEET